MTLFQQVNEAVNAEFRNRTIAEQWLMNDEDEILEDVEEEEWEV